MKSWRNVKQFNGFRKIKWQPLLLQIPIMMSLTLGQSGYAQASTSAFSNAISRSASMNDVFNELFQYHLNSSPDSFVKDASKYLLSLPPLTQEQEASQNMKCSANAPAEYCRLQQNFNGFTPAMFGEAVINDLENPKIGDASVQSIREQIIDPSLAKNDTMVIIIPGIFGEFINQTAFGEVFGEGYATRNLEASNFSKEFKSSLQKCDKATSNINPCYDGRFLLSRWVPTFDGKAPINFDNVTQINNEFIDDWMKVASVDTPNHDRTLFKIVVPKLKAMSMESLGSQSVLADLYLRRISKFMDFYTKTMGHKVPSRIIFAGYSRGTPVGYEMLAKLNSGDLKYKNLAWAKNISAMVSMAGVTFGSALADASVIGENERDWSKTPLKTKMTQALRFLANKFIPLPDDDEHIKQFIQDGTLGRIITNNVHVLKFLNEKFKTYRQQLNEEIKAINDGQLSISEASGLAKAAVIASQIELARKGLGYAYTLTDDKATLEQKKASVKGLKEIASQIDWSGVKNQVNTLVASSSVGSDEQLKQSGSELYQVLNKYIQLKNDSKALSIFSALNLGLQDTLDANNGLVSNGADSIDLVTVEKKFSDLLSLMKEFKPEELLVKLNGSSLVNNDPGSAVQNIMSSFTQDLKSKYTALKDSLPDSQAMNAMNAQLMKNWGANDSIQRIKEASIHGKEVLKIAIMKELNLNLAKFFFYFNRAWEGASELGTNSRLQWWKTRGALLPSNIKYYTVGGILDQPNQAFFQKGIDIGWRVNTLDDRFLVLNNHDLSNVGKGDGLPGEFVGSRINDSQVDLYKTHLWPSVAGELTNGHCFDSKIVGVARTHHWGLALPYAFTNLDADKKPIPNPFPREVLVKALVDSITHDLETVPNVCTNTNEGSN
ncbi:MAG: hypothetical protein ACXVCY_14565 [Pseudobdellovibrionaceae bacterium]